jgi:hypothetical protein
VEEAVDSSSHPMQADGIEINQVADGYVIYDPARERIHHLNHTAALVLELCNGRVAAGDLPGLVQAAFGMAEAPVQEIADCLEKLRQEELVR